MRRKKLRENQEEAAEMEPMNIRCVGSSLPM